MPSSQYRPLAVYLSIKSQPLTSIQSSKQFSRQTVSLIKKQEHSHAFIYVFGGVNRLFHSIRNIQQNT